MSRMYTVSFGTSSGFAVATAIDFFEITAAAGKNCRIRGLELGQSTDYKDAEEEGLIILLKTGATTSGSGGNTDTPVPLNVTDAAAGFAAETINTTKASGGTIVTHHVMIWNVRMPLVWLPPDGMCLELTGSRRFTVELLSAPADSISCHGTLYVEEFG